MADEDSIFGGGDTASDFGAGGALAAAIGASGRIFGQVTAEMIEAVADRLGNVQIPVSGSSCIAGLGYHIGSGDMEVRFHDGSVYFYPQVNMSDFLAFLSARSKGSHYNAYWRKKEELIQGKKKGSHMILGGGR